MWQVSANNPNGDFFLSSQMSREASRELHRELSNSGNWAKVHSVDMSYDEEEEQQS
tara:strand:+ start:311 stop:478 length:168 start_codon:yes stop_codon:yes gene_type:complete